MRSLGGLFFLGLVFLSQSGCRPHAENQPILLGHVAPFSGPEKLTSQHARQAIQLALEKANQEGNAIPGRRVAVLHVDSHGNLDMLQAETVRLITVNRVVALFGGTNASQVERLGHAAQPYEVALVTSAALPAEFLPENVFSINASPAFQGQVLARFVLGELKAERVVAFTDARQPAYTAVADAFNEEFSKGSGHATRQWTYESEADLAKAIAEVKELNPQVILYVGAPAELVKARALLQKAGPTVPVVFGGDGEHFATLAADPKASNGIYLATPYVLEGGTPELQNFVKEYQQRFHEAPDNAALLAYDGVRVLLQAMRRSEPISAARMRTELASPSGEDFESLTGRLVFNKDHSARRPLFMVRLENGNMREPKRFNPEAQ